MLYIYDGQTMPVGFMIIFTGSKSSSVKSITTEVTQLSYTSSLEYAKEVASNAIKNRKPIKETNLNVSLLTISNQKEISYDNVMSTACSRATRYVAHMGGAFKDHPWDRIIQSWLKKTFVVTYWRDKETRKINGYVEILTPNGSQKCLDLDVVCTSIVRQIRAHFTSLKQIHKQDDLDHVPLWFKNETTKAHDLAVIAKYKKTTPFTIPLGGNLRTTNIKTPVTFGKECLNLTDTLNGEVKTVVGQTAMFLKPDYTFSYDGETFDSLLVEHNYFTRRFESTMDKLTEYAGVITEDAMALLEANSIVPLLPVEAIRRSSSGSRGPSKKKDATPTTKDGDMFSF